MLGKDKQTVMRDIKPAKDTADSENSYLERGLEMLQISDDRFKALFDAQYHAEQIEAGKMKLSFRSMQAALIILAYENEPLLYAPSRLLHALLDLEENLSEWRFKHMMVCGE